MTYAGRSSRRTATTTLSSCPDSTFSIFERVARADQAGWCLGILAIMTGWLLSLERPGSQRAVIGACLVLHAVFWALVHNALQLDDAIHHDMSEAWAWGQEWQLGYSKHPPLFAWVTAAWFSFVPRGDGTFYLLTTSVGAVAMAGVWALIGRLAGRREQVLAVLLLSLTPAVTIQLAKFNANTALLLTWPWTMYFLVRMLQDRRIVDGAMLGLFAGLAMLTKYYSVVLLGTCAVALLLHPDCRRLLRSAAPYVAALVFCTVLAPHVVWLLHSGAPTVDYALAKISGSAWSTRLHAFGVLATTLAVMAAAAAFIAIVFGRHGVEMLARNIAATGNRATLWLAAIVWGPLAFTLLAAWVFNVGISNEFLIPGFVALPGMFVVAARRPVTDVQVRRALGSICLLWIGAALAASFVCYVAVAKPTPGTHRAVPLVATQMTDDWRARFGVRLRFVGGIEDLAMAIAFYSADAPSYVNLQQRDATPWADDDRLQQGGVLVACLAADTACALRAAALGAVASARVRISGVRLRDAGAKTVRDVHIFMRPPGALPTN